MSGIGSRLQQALQDPSARQRQIVVVYQMKDSERLSQPRRLRELAYFYDVVLDGAAEARDCRLWGSRICMFYDPASPESPLADARQAQERVSGTWEKVPWALSAGVSVGDCIVFQGPHRDKELVGDAIDCAVGLADRAPAGAVLVDSKLADQVERATSRSVVSFGHDRRMRIPDVEPILYYREFFWSGESHENKRSSRSTRKGTLVRWDEERGRGLIITDSDERFYTDRRYLAVGSGTPKEGGTLLFLDEDPASAPNANRLAAAAVILGDTLQGLVTAVDLASGYAFIEVRDQAGFAQQLITAKDVDLESLSVDATVEFFVDENARGATAAQVRVSSPAPVPSEAPVAARFIAALAAHLRRQGAAGAAAAVLRQSSLDWVSTYTPPTRQRAEVIALARFAVDHWARRGVQAIGEGSLALGLLQEAEGTFNPLGLEQTVGAIRKRLKARPDYSEAGPNPITPRAVVRVLTEIQIALRKLGDVHENALDPLGADSVAAATEHFGFALSEAFRGGIVTSLPPETLEVLGALREA
jgi:cold shock CspA family protein